MKREGQSRRAVESYDGVRDASWRPAARMVRLKCLKAGPFSTMRSLSSHRLGALRAPRGTKAARSPSGALR
jgi:hypothetical protein